MEDDLKQGEIGITEEGELSIPADFWSDTETQEVDTEEVIDQAQDDHVQEQIEQAEEKPALYTAEELGEAFANNSVDPNRLSEELKQYYLAIEDANKRRASAASEAERIRQQMMQQYQNQFQEQAHQQTQPQKSQRVNFEELNNAAKIYACREYLGIDPDDLDEFDPQHNRAIQLAMGEIKERVNQYQQEQLAAHRQQEESQRAVNERYATVANVYAEYKTKVPELDHIGDVYFPQWQSALTVQEAQQVQYIMAHGDEKQLKGLFEKIIGDYRKTKEGGNKNQPKQVASPPPVLGAVGGADEGRDGVVDISKLSEMTTEEQARFLIQNKFVG